jgi:hypothetical protein
MDENIPKMHTPFYFFMPGWGNIPISDIACMIFKYAPAANQVNFGMLL